MSDLPPPLPALASLKRKMPSPKERLATLLGVAPESDEQGRFRSFELEAGDVVWRAETQRAPSIEQASVNVIVLLLKRAALAKVVPAQPVLEGKAHALHEH